MAVKKRQMSKIDFKKIIDQLNVLSAGTYEPYVFQRMVKFMFTNVGEDIMLSNVQN